MKLFERFDIKNFASILPVLIIIGMVIGLILGFIVVIKN